MKLASVAISARYLVGPLKKRERKSLEEEIFLYTSRRLPVFCDGRMA